MTYCDSHVVDLYSSQWSEMCLVLSFTCFLSQDDGFCCHGDNTFPSMGSPGPFVNPHNHFWSSPVTSLYFRDVELDSTGFVDLSTISHRADDSLVSTRKQGSFLSQRWPFLPLPFSLSQPSPHEKGHTKTCMCHFVKTLY